MKRFGGGLWVAAAFIGAVAALPAHAQTISDDPLHGFCGAGTCIDNGTNTPISTLTNQFGFDISPGPQTGVLTLDFLVPDNTLNASSLSFSVSGTQGGANDTKVISSTAVSVFKVANVAADWKSGSLASFLGISASPNNPIGAYLPATQVLDPGATGFFVYQVVVPGDTVGSLTNQTKLVNPSNPSNGNCSPAGSCGPLLTITASLATGSYAVGFLDTGGGNIVATANSGALLVTNGHPAPHFVPEPGAWTLLVPGLLGLAALRRRRRA
jgi:hypothetical protein